MNIKGVSLILLSSLYCATPGYTANITDTYSWDSGEGSGVYYRENNKASLQNFYAQVNHSKNGKQRLYFYSLDLDVFVVPEDIKIREMMNHLDSISNRATIMVFNGQAIKMNIFTETYYKTQKNYYYYTPETEQGHNYVVNLFKKSTSPVKIEFRDKTFYIPSQGFTKTWNSNGGNAI